MQLEKIGYVLEALSAKSSEVLQPAYYETALKGKTLKITAKAGSAGRLFGSVTTKEVAEELRRQLGVEVDKRKISMEDIKAFGSYKAEIKLYTGVTAQITVMVTE